MIDRNDVNGLLIAVLWLLMALWGALDGLTLFVVIYLGVSIALYVETVKQWNAYGLSWEFIVMFIGTVIALCTAIVYEFSILGYIERIQIGPEYLFKLHPSYAGLLVYTAFQARLLRREHREICKASEKINGHHQILRADKS